LFQETEREIDEASTPRAGSKPIMLNEKYVSTWTRYKEVQHPLFVSHFRNAPMNVTRFALLIVFAIVHTSAAECTHQSSFHPATYLPPDCVPVTACKNGRSADTEPPGRLDCLCLVAQRGALLAAQCIAIGILCCRDLTRIG
jgi:hypothetical protein